MASINYPLENTSVSHSDKSVLNILYRWIATTDHKKLGIMYIIAMLLFFVASGLMAVVIRLQLAYPNSHVVSPETFNQLFTMHGTSMVFLVGMPMVAGLGNYLVPLMIGARDMAFPRLNAFGFWAFLFGGILLYSSYAFGAVPDVGWFGYAPLTNKTFNPGPSTDFWVLGVLVAGFGTISSAINVVATTISMRCPGMTLKRMPMFVWVMFIDAWLILLVFPPLAACQIMLMIDRLLGANFFNVNAGGTVLLWQHIFWIFGHPEVYVLIFPIFAIMSEVVPVFSRKPIFGKPAMVAAIIMIFFIGSGVWAHHMFTVGYDVYVQHILRHGHNACRHSHRYQNLQLDSDHVRRQDSFFNADVVCLRISAAVLSGRLNRHHASDRALRLAASPYLFRCRPLPLHADWWLGVRTFCRHLLLVSKSYRQDVQRNDRPFAFLDFPDRLQRDVYPDALRRLPGNATPRVYLSAWPRSGNLEPHFHLGRCDSNRWHPALRSERHLGSLERSEGG